MFGRAKRNGDSAPKKEGNVLLTVGEIRADEPFTHLELPDGRIVQLPTHLLLPVEAAEEPALPQEGTIIPVMEETLTVDKRTVETGKVMLHKTVQEFAQTVEEVLAVRSYAVERITLNQKVPAIPEARREGATTIYPVVEERLVLAKELVLVEEIRVTEQTTQRRDVQTVMLQREQVDVERVPLIEQAR